MQKNTHSAGVTTISKNAVPQETSARSERPGQGDANKNSLSKQNLTAKIKTTSFWDICDYV